jgi:hypothetical protein
VGYLTADRPEKESETKRGECRGHRLISHLEQMAAYAMGPRQHSVNGDKSLKVKPACRQQASRRFSKGLIRWQSRLFQVIVQISHHIARFIVAVVHIRHHVPTARYAIPAVLLGEAGKRIRSGSAIIAPSELVAAPSETVNVKASLRRETRKEREDDGGGERPPDRESSGESSPWKATPRKSLAGETTPRNTAPGEAALRNLLRVTGAVIIIRHIQNHLSSYLFEQITCSIYTMFSHKYLFS